MIIGYLCRDCALLGGAIAPDHHVCTYHVGECVSCGEHKALCHHTDWDWPGVDIPYGEGPNTREL